MALATLAEAQATASRAGNALLMPRMGAELRRSANARFAAALQRAGEARHAFDALPRGEATARAWAALDGPWTAWTASARELMQAEAPFDRLRQEGVDPGDPRAVAAYDAGWAAWMRTRDAYAPAEKALAEARRAVDAELAAERAAAGRTLRWDGLTQRNAASAEQSSSAVAELSSQAAALSAVVETFHLERAGGSVA